ncbi:arsenate reductase ArsC [Hymenobacter sp. BT188]|uniref:arsenate reductase ArsC n=1 Tax=Hymenobacter sp. BT188 TaxID=2763504 RepID=UPI001651438C|nr:arsenate reductase ArsC [Hymenobacter sp. BT188]MBC6609252.1 arsenate reductase ArsC [Hymenobacter sp. BT188]
MSRSLQKNVLVFCPGNGCRSQLLHGYLQHLLGERVAVYSAGVETQRLNPRTVRVMAEDGVDIALHSSDRVDEFAHVCFDLVITVSDQARQLCSGFALAVRSLHQHFPDPAQASGSEEEVLGAFRRVRDQIKAYAATLAQGELAGTIPVLSSVEPATGSELPLPVG